MRCRLVEPAERVLDASRGVGGAALGWGLRARQFGLHRGRRSPFNMSRTWKCEIEQNRRVGRVLVQLY